MDGEDRFIVEDDASKSTHDIFTPRLDSGFLSGGSLSSCQQNLSLSSCTSPGVISSREYNRLDSGLCEQMSDSLTISPDPKLQTSTSPLCTSNIPSPLPQLQSAQPPPVVTANVVENFYGVDADGDCQLHLAIADGATEIVFALIRMAPDPSYLDIQNNELYAPLHIAVLVNQQAMVRRLVVAGAATGKYLSIFNAQAFSLDYILNLQTCRVS
jgi:hypothetical protein